MRRVTLVFFLFLLLPSPVLAADELPDVADVLAVYNAGIEAAMTGIDSLFVRQEVIEHCPDGEDRTASAHLSYNRADGLSRTVIESDLRYPSGKYRLESLVGPVLRPDEYEVELTGVEEMEGEECLRLELRALVRDVDHFDGTLWVSVVDGGPVRIEGGVADRPFPAREILLDKSFIPVSGGFRLVRRHTGEVEIGLLVGSSRGVRHIFYEGYVVRTARR